jgi:hypothetical protein
MPVCTRCLEDKTADSFHRDRRRPTGIRQKCKVCAAATRPSRAGSEASAVHWAKYYSEKREALLSAMRDSPTRKAASRRRYAEKRDEILVKQRAYAMLPESKASNAARERKRTVRRKAATPAWLTAAQHQEIRNFYWHAKDATRVTGEPYHVDHILPLQGRQVCGLHVPWNLRVVPADINQRKHANIGDY